MECGAFCEVGTEFWGFINEVKLMSDMFWSMCQWPNISA